MCYREVKSDSGEWTGFDLGRAFNMCLLERKHTSVDKVFWRDTTFKHGAFGVVGHLREDKCPRRLKCIIAFNPFNDRSCYD